ncbi:MAG: phage tail tube protein [Phycisphaeraceae bacterium]
MSDKLGMEAKLYFADALLDGDTVTPGTATWNEIDKVKDVTLNLETAEADMTTRGNNGWRATRATLKDGSIEFEMNWAPGNTAFEAIRDAWLAAGEIPIAAMSGDIDTEGEEGLVANMSVTNFSRNEPLEEGMTVSVTLKPSSQIEWYEVPAA